MTDRGSSLLLSIQTYTREIRQSPSAQLIMGFAMDDMGMDHIISVLCTRGLI